MVCDCRSESRDIHEYVGVRGWAVFSDQDLVFDTGDEPLFKIAASERVFGVGGHGH